MREEAMRFKLTVARGLIFALAATIPAAQASADGLNLGSFFSHFHHQNYCDAKQSVVRLPAQEIRIETAAPRVIVGSATRVHGHSGFRPVAQMAFMPVASG